jgi:hypothetical protein
MAREEFIDSAYSINEVYTGGASDQKGHSVNPRVKMPDHWLAAIHAVVDDLNAFPEYRRNHVAFIRDAIHHRLVWASEQTNRGDMSRVRHHAAMLKAEAQLQLRTQTRDQFTALSKLLDSTFTTALIEGDLTGIQELMDDFATTLNDWPEPYRTKLQASLHYWEKRIIG